MSIETSCQSSLTVCFWTGSTGFTGFLGPAERRAFCLVAKIAADRVAILAADTPI